ncbi:MAG: SDR family oxidoreductase [Alphaproteobacteria bacterium]|nr:SDR family oxidoreductase [Alphaproteobacteria bacterium]
MTAHVEPLGYWSEKIVVVTGATGALGQAVTTQLAQAMHTQQGSGAVIAVSRLRSGLELLDDAVRTSLTPNGTSETDSRVILAPVSVSDPKQLVGFAGGLAQRVHHIDMIVHCAWQQLPLQPLTDVSAKQWDSMWQVNVRGTLLLLQALHPFLKQSSAPTVVVPMRAHDESSDSSPTPPTPPTPPTSPNPPTNPTPPTSPPINPATVRIHRPLVRSYYGADAIAHAALTAGLSVYRREFPALTVHQVDLPAMASRARGVTHPGTVQQASSPDSVARALLQWVTANPAATEHGQSGS